MDKKRIRIGEFFLASDYELSSILENHIVSMNIALFFT